MLAMRESFDSISRFCESMSESQDPVPQHHEVAPTDQAAVIRPAASPSLRRPIGSAALLLLLAGTATPAWADDAQTPSDPSSEEDEQTIIVIGDPLALIGIAPERSLDADLIDAYGFSTVRELYEQVLLEAGESDDDPVVLINGERVPDLGDAAAYPVEAVSRVDILPRGSAARLGGSPQRRVISITLRNNVRTLAFTAGYRVATEGDWSARRGEAIFSRIRGPDRLNIALRINNEDRLLESERGIIQPETFRPFDLVGNVIADPRTGGDEIDPALSALAGRIVTRAPVPGGVSAPSLQDFAANANDVNETDLGRFRTLRPSSDAFQLSVSAANRLTPWLRSTVQARFNYSESESLRGLPSTVFILPATNPFSPFTQDAGIALYGRDPFRQRSSGYTGNVTLGLNALVEGWQLNFTGSYVRADRRSRSERLDPQSSQPIILSSDRNPFAGSLDDLLPILADRSRSVLDNGSAEFRATGSPFSLPAGPVSLTVGAGLNFNELVARSVVAGRRRYYRSQRDLYANGDVPLTSRRNGVLPQVGDLSATYEIGLTDVSDFGTLTRYAYGLVWSPRDWLRIVAIENRARRAPDADDLGSAIVVTPGERYFDFLTGETVDVTEISGGNPLLLAERLRTRRLRVNAGPLPSLNLRLNAEYTSTATRNLVSTNPPASAAILLAFPDQFRRDENGTLTTVDVRAVNFTRQRREQLRYGLNLVAPLGPAPARAQRPADEERESSEGESDEGMAAGPVPTALRSRPRLQLSAAHTIILNYDVLIRPTVPIVDLLAGGAVGIGGAPPRHQLNLNATLGGRGIGATFNAVWRSESFLTIETAVGTDRLRFEPLATVNLRTFVTGGRLFPNRSWARGTRLSVSVQNLFNDRQEVRDTTGQTPLRYQRAYRDPLGRTVEFEFRKTF